MDFNSLVPTTVKFMKGKGAKERPQRLITCKIHK